MPYPYNDYHTYRLEHGMSPAEQRAADQRIGELAATLAGLRRHLAHSFGRGFGIVALVAKLRRTKKEQTVPVQTSARY
jgi:hypothetical protein